MAPLPEVAEAAADGAADAATDGATRLVAALGGIATDEWPEELYDERRTSDDKRAATRRTTAAGVTRVGTLQASADRSQLGG